MAVGLSIDFDNETVALKDGVTEPAFIAQGEYGPRAGLPRILRLLDKLQIPATFFTPAVSAILHPQPLKDIAAQGRHEFALHGWIHERSSSLEEKDERGLMRRSVETLTRLTGTKPVGIRTPAWDFSQATIHIIRELGLIYDSSLMGDDRPYEILLEGAPSGIVELPVGWILDDTPYFSTGNRDPAALRNTLLPEHVLQIWQAEFDMAYEEGSLFTLTVHPHIIGRRSRMAMLERLIGPLRSRPDVWFATHADIARYVSRAAA